MAKHVLGQNQCDRIVGGDGRTFLQQRHWLYSPLIMLAGLLMLVEVATAQDFPDPPPGGHGMLVVGTKGKIYLLHLAMRRGRPHTFQLVLEVEFTRQDSTEISDGTFVGDTLSLDTTSPSQVYFQDRAHTGNTTPLYTYQPTEVFVLTDIPKGTKTSFQGHIIRGHFERPQEKPQALLSNVTVQVKQILYFQDLRKTTTDIPHPLSEGRLDFLFFGTNGEYFITHRVTFHGQLNNPNNNGFHQVFAIEEDTAKLLNFDSTRQALPLQIDSATATPLGRLPQAGGAFSSSLLDLIQGAETPLPFPIKLKPEHYLEILG